MAQNLFGKVTSIAMQKTVVVEVQSKMPHPRYKKVISVSKKLKAHNEDSSVAVGQMVEVMSCRPVSKTKNYKVVKIIA